MDPATSEGLVSVPLEADAGGLATAVRAEIDVSESKENSTASVFVVTTRALPRGASHRQELPCCRVRTTNDFVWIRGELKLRYPGLLLPPVPTLTDGVRQADVASLVRRLGRWVCRIANSPIFLQSEPFRDFLFNAADLPGTHGPVRLLPASGVPTAAGSTSAATTARAAASSFLLGLSSAVGEDRGFVRNPVLIDCRPPEDDEYFEERRKQLLEIEERCVALRSTLAVLDGARKAVVASQVVALGREWRTFSDCSALETQLSACASVFGQLLGGQEANATQQVRVWQETIEDAFVEALGLIAGAKDVMNERTRLLHASDAAHRKTAQLEESQRKLSRSLDFDPSKAQHAQRLVERSIETHRKARAVYLGASDAMRAQMALFESEFVASLASALQLLTRTQTQILQTELGDHEALLAQLRQMRAPSHPEDNST